MMLPILISVSVAPVSYLPFWAKADVEASAIVRAAESSPNRMRIAGISVSLGRLMCRVVGAGALRGPWLALNTSARQPANKKPPASQARGASFSRRPRKPRRGIPKLIAQIAGDDLAEQVPLLALEAHHLELADRREVGRRGVDLDARQQRVGLEILQARRLLHHVLAREIVAALLQHLHQRLRHAIAVHHGAVELVGVGVI